MKPDATRARKATFLMHALYLKPGEYYLGDHPTKVTTVLGSCVAVSMYHRPSGLAAICHAVAPDCDATASCPSGCPKLQRYVRCMIPAMVHAFSSRGVSPANIETKLFGGAAMIDGDNRRDPGKLVGAQNIAAAREVIQQCGLVLKSSDVGGRVGRKIIFETATGDILLKRLHPSSWRLLIPDKEMMMTPRRSNGKDKSIDR